VVPGKRTDSGGRHRYTVVMPDTKLEGSTIRGTLDISGYGSTPPAEPPTATKEESPDVYQAMD
jgi:hypothetical protein